MMAAFKTSRLVPRLRFPEFRNAGKWKVKTLRHILNAEVSKASQNELEFVENGYSVYGASGFVGRIKTYEQDEDYIAIVKDGSGVGRLYIHKKFTSVLGTLTYLKLRDQNDHNLIWVYHLLSTLDLSKYIVGTGIPHIYFKDYSNESVPVPTLQEQRKIANCFGSLDDLIAVESRKLKALRWHRQGLMQQLFPQSGETVPRIRFPEFCKAGEWEKKKLGDLGTLISGLTYSPKDVRDGGLLVLRSSNIQSGEITLDDCVYVRRDINSANLTQRDDILICVRNGSKPLIGKNAIVPKGMPACTHGAFMTIFRASAPHFARLLLQTTAFQKQVAADLGATINSINKNQLLKYRFTVPKPAEQQKIADCLGSLDNLITAANRKLEALQKHKQGLMQQLFPSLEVYEQ